MSKEWVEEHEPFEGVYRLGSTLGVLLLGFATYGVWRWYLSHVKPILR